jgi:hypothetical protein
VGTPRQGTHFDQYFPNEEWEECRTDRCSQTDRWRKNTRSQSDIESRGRTAGTGFASDLAKEGLLEFLKSNQNNFNFGIGPDDATQWVLNVQPVIPITWYITDHYSELVGCQRRPLDPADRRRYWQAFQTRQAAD